MWCVIQVQTRKEETVRSVIQRWLNPDLYERCFCIRRERIWRRDGQCLLHEETMFPGYLFLVTDRPLPVYWELKKIPQFTKLLRAEEEFFLPVAADEQHFLQNLLQHDPKDVVRLSTVHLNEAQEILSAEGPLASYLDKVVKKKLRLRYVMVEAVLFGQKRTVLMGIRTEEDQNLKTE